MKEVIEAAGKVGIPARSGNKTVSRIEAHRIRSMFAFDRSPGVERSEALRQLQDRLKEGRSQSAQYV